MGEEGVLSQSTGDVAATAAQDGTRMSDAEVAVRAGTRRDVPASAGVRGGRTALHRLLPRAGLAGQWAASAGAAVLTFQAAGLAWLVATDAVAPGAAWGGFAWIVCGPLAASALALYDSLTQLPNRTLLIDRIGQAIRDAQRYKREFALLMMDLDRFKLVNDTMGHGVGDEMLREVARRLCATVRDSDTVARLGGDEFMVLLTGGRETATEIATRIERALHEPMWVDGESLDVGASIGIAHYPAHGHDVELLMRHADIAMYQAKRQQGGWVVFDGVDRESERSHLSLLGDMRRALERGEYEIDWQPRLALATGRVIGLEGLVRWNHPSRGRLQPGDFIAFAEETGFVREITRWVVAAGVQHAARLVREGLDLHVSLNVSALDVQQRDFAQDVARALQTAGLDPSRLVLEITESGVVADLGDALATLRSLADAGVRLSVDDFGTGYATLAQLQQLPVHELKIDRSFVSGMCENRGSEAIVRATVDLARKLGLSVAAEGVETLKELKALQALGCAEAQGFFIAKPLRADEVGAWVRQANAGRGAVAA